MKLFKHLALTLTLVAATLPVLAADKEEKTIKLKDAPEAVQAAIKKAAEGAKIKQVEKVTDGGKVIYEAVIQKGGKSIEIEIAPDGKIIQAEEEVKLADCPAAVQATIKTQSAGGKVKLVEKVTKDGKTYYEAEILKGGKELEVLIAEDGKVMESKEEAPEK